MAGRLCLSDKPKTRRTILFLWLTLSAVFIVGYLGRDHASNFIQSHNGAIPGGFFSSTPPPSPIFGDKMAVIVETRMLDNLVPLLMHFSSVLGPSWQVILYAKRGVWQMPTAGPFVRAIDDGRIRVLYLPPGMDMTNYISVSVFWTRPWIWEQLQNVTRVLTFQTDSIICSKANVTADDFLEWDYVGAPIAPMLGRGYNGGLSIRNPKKFLDIVRNNNFDKDAESGHVELMIEDQWFYTKLMDLEGSKLPSPDIAKKFSVESLFYEAPLAFHQPHEWHKDNFDDIRKYCPEVELIYR